MAAHGDIGNLDERGFLRITDRKKDLFKTSGGKYVAPSAIESIFKGVCPYASQLIVGDGRNFVSALVTLDPDAMAGWAEQVTKTKNYRTMFQDQIPILQ